MPEYKPALNETERLKIGELMEELQRVQSREETLKKELRTLIYKVEALR
jgi:hypothetical protein